MQAVYWGDVVITRCSDRVADIVATETGISDHLLLTCRLPASVMMTEYVPSEGRKWNDFSLDAFRSDLADSILCCAESEWFESVTTDDLFQICNDQLLRLIDKHAPRYTRKRKSRVLSPWFDNECRMFKRSVRRLERKYRKSRQPADRLAWVLKQKEKAAFFQQKERAYWSNGREKEKFQISR